jgi:hypothetical protein
MHDVFIGMAILRRASTHGLGMANWDMGAE